MTGAIHVGSVGRHLGQVSSNEIYHGLNCSAVKDCFVACKISSGLQHVRQARFMIYLTP